MKSEIIKENLIKNTDLLIKALEDYGFGNIKCDYEKEIRCGYSDESNPTSVVINLNNLYCTIFSKNIKGDIYTILSWKSGQDFKQVHKYLNSLFGDDIEIVETKKRMLFGGAFKKYIGCQTEITDHIYTEHELKEYSKRPNQRFLDDGISVKTQLKFGVGYSFTDHFITIPWVNTDGDCVGVKGRNNDDDCGDYKYIALKKFKKSNHLYGYFQNRDNIIGSKIVVLFESEKATLQCDTFGFNKCASIGSHCLSDQQIRILKNDVNKILLGYDSDIDEDILINECKKIKRIAPNIKVGYILDTNGLLDEKCSPTDKGKEIFARLIKDNIIWYEVNNNE